MEPPPPRLPPAPTALRARTPARTRWTAWTGASRSVAQPPRRPLRQRRRPTPTIPRHPAPQDMVSLIQRRSLFDHPTVRAALDQFWRSPALHPDGDLKSCPEEEYVAMAARLRAVLNPPGPESHLRGQERPADGTGEPPSPDPGSRSATRPAPTSAPPHRPDSGKTGPTPQPAAFTGWSGDRHSYHFRASPHLGQRGSGGRRVAFPQFQHSLFDMAGAPLGVQGRGWAPFLQLTSPHATITQMPSSAHPRPGTMPSSSVSSSA